LGSSGAKDQLKKEKSVATLYKTGSFLLHWGERKWILRNSLCLAQQLRIYAKSGMGVRGSGSICTGFKQQTMGQDIE
jgi:hypothetical protein